MALELINGAILEIKRVEGASKYKGSRETLADLIVTFQELKAEGEMRST